jgi:single-stranded DNA-specific DHH superfamily exonuclease
MILPMNGRLNMSVNTDLSILELMKLAADNHHKRITLSDDERAELVAAIKKRAADELEYGQEIEQDSVRLIRRVTGAVGLYFNS